MRRNLAVAILLACPLLFAQSAESPELEKARDDAARVRELVGAGALPRQALDDAEMVLQEARDDAILGRTLYGSPELSELTVEQAKEMVAAASRLVERQIAQREEVGKLVREGAVPESHLAPYEREIAVRREALALAQERAELFRELVEMVRLEQELERALAESPEDARAIAERFDGSGVFLSSQLSVVRLEFGRKFRRQLPISANGATALHRSMGFDHRGRVDVALHPDSREGAWLKGLLERLQVPYFAFRGAAAGKSTGAHIHIGPPSNRTRSGN